MLQPIVMGSETLQEFLHDFFHEFRNPSTHQSRISYEGCMELIAMVVRNAHRVQKQSKEFVDCIMGLTSPLQFSSCEVLEVVINAMNYHADTCKDQKIALRTAEGLGNLPAIQADERRLFSVFYNLINNAISEVAAEATITVGGYQDGPFVVLAIADTGKGMSSFTRERLFSSQALSQKSLGNCYG
ncbi:MAG: HAMP domain-containing histidine kinase, partial [Nitrospirota bacterium]